MESINYESSDDSHSVWFSSGFWSEWNEFSKKQFTEVRANLSDNDLRLIHSWSYWFANKSGWSQHDSDDIAQSVIKKFLDREFFAHSIGLFCFFKVHDCGSELRESIDNFPTLLSSERLSLDVGQEICSARDRNAFEILDWIQSNFSSRDAQIVTTLWVEDCSQAEIAEKIGVSLATVHRVVKKAREVLQSRFLC